MKRQWEHEELVEHWTLDVEDRAFLSNKTGSTRLGFAVLLKFFRQEGRFPWHKNEVPSIVISFLATQVSVAPEAYVQYAWQGRTIEYHRAQIREALGFRESSVADGEHMQAWLVAQILPREGSTTTAIAIATWISAKPSKRTTSSIDLLATPLMK